MLESKFCKRSLLTCWTKLLSLTGTYYDGYYYSNGWLCDDGYQCIDDNDRCDGNFDCYDDSDEDGCGKRALFVTQQH